MSKVRKVILPLATSRAHVRGLLHGIAKYSRLHGPWIFYTHVSPDRTDDVSSWLHECGADGIIVPDARKNRELLETGLPAIVYRIARKRIPHLPAIIADNATIGAMAAEHLLERGFRHFAYCGLKNRPWAGERSRSFARRVRQAGSEPHIFYISSRLGSWRSFEGARHGLTEWLKALPKPVGLMAGNDVCGSYVIEACRIAGLQVPEEVAVIGVDNDELVCDLTDPPMSSIALATQKAGYEAAELLDRLMAGEKKMTGQIILVRATHIVTRPSTDILAIEDRTVADAIRFIRRGATRALQVTDVVDHVAMSRRNLELRFHRVLGRSIYSEIKRVRIHQIMRMLCETDLSISEIAMKLGHVSDKHIGRYFKQQTGMSLKGYRRQCRQ